MPEQCVQPTETTFTPHLVSWLVGIFPLSLNHLPPVNASLGKLGLWKAINGHDTDLVKDGSGQGLVILCLCILPIDNGETD